MLNIYTTAIFGIWVFFLFGLWLFKRSMRYKKETGLKRNHLLTRTMGIAFMLFAISDLIWLCFVYFQSGKYSTIGQIMSGFIWISIFLIGFIVGMVSFYLMANVLRKN